MSGERTRKQTTETEITALHGIIAALIPNPVPASRKSVLSLAGLVAQVRSAYTRSHPELGRETLQRP